MKKILCFIFVVISFCGCANSNMKLEDKNKIETIDTETVFEIIDNKDTYIIDVREDYEYRSGHLKNAYNISLTMLNEETTVNIPKNSKVIVYCQSGNRSKMASQILLDMGFNVYDMGGIVDWKYDIITE